MIRTITKKIPALHSALLYFKHRMLLKKTASAYAKYEQETAVRKLQLGAGTNELNGWFNTDYFERQGIHFLNVTKPFPFPSNTFQYIFTEHHIEHISYKDAVFMLTEICRVSKPGGLIKIITPNLEQYIRYYADGRLGDALIKEHAYNWIYNGFHNAKNYKPIDEYYDAHFINDIFFNYNHRFIYDEGSLTGILNKAGFVIINEDEDSLTAFANINSHWSAFDKTFNLSLTAQKPLES